MGRMKTITMYELLGLIKDGKAPKKILCRNDYFYEYKYIEELNDYEDINTGDLLFEDRYCINKMLNEPIEILEDEEEFEDIEECKRHYLNTYGRISQCRKSEEHIINSINQLIRNQKKIIERLENESK